MLSINDNLPALKNLGRFESAVLKVKAESPSKMAICVSQGKSPYLQNSALKNIPTDCRLMWVFSCVPFVNTDGITSQTIQVEVPQERAQVAIEGL